MKYARVACALAGLLAACSSPHRPEPTPGAVGFDRGAPPGWRAASTGGFGPEATWQVRADPHAVSAPNVVSLSATNHSAGDRFNLYWTYAERITDGRVSVLVRADAGAIDQGGGPMWRVQDASNYYVCRVIRSSRTSVSTS